jgi:hypothetical protein
VTSGTRRGGNHAGTSRTTLVNVNASPVPTSTRPSAASPIECDSASTSWPAPMIAAPTATSRRDPNRSSSAPTGTCSPAYTASWRTTKRLSTAAVAPKRSCACGPATPSEARWKTATT